MAYNEYMFLFFFLEFDIRESIYPGCFCLKQFTLFNPEIGDSSFILGMVRLFPMFLLGFNIYAVKILNLMALILFSWC